MQREVEKIECPPTLKSLAFGRAGRYGGGSHEQEEVARSKKAVVGFSTKSLHKEASWPVP